MFGRQRTPSMEKQFGGPDARKYKYASLERVGHGAFWKYVERSDLRTTVYQHWDTPIFHVRAADAIGKRNLRDWQGDAADEYQWLVVNINPHDSRHTRDHMNDLFRQYRLPMYASGDGVYAIVPAIWLDSRSPGLRATLPPINFVRGYDSRYGRSVPVAGAEAPCVHLKLDTAREILVPCAPAGYGWGFEANTAYMRSSAMHWFATTSPGEVKVTLKIPGRGVERGVWYTKDNKFRAKTKGGDLMPSVQFYPADRTGGTALSVYQNDHATRLVCAYNTQASRMLSALWKGVRRLARVTDADHKPFYASILNRVREKAYFRDFTMASMEVGVFENGTVGVVPTFANTFGIVSHVAQDAQSLYYDTMASPEDRENMDSSVHGRLSTDLASETDAMCRSYVKQGNSLKTGPELLAYLLTWMTHHDLVGLLAHRHPHMVPQGQSTYVVPVNV